MAQRAAHFTQAGEDRYLPTEFAQSHWGPDHLNGPALVGLAARALEDKFGLPDFLPARLTVDLFKAARGVPTTTKVTLVRDGRRVRNAECEISQDGVVVVRATMVAYRRSESPRGEEWTSATDFTWPDELGGAGLSYMGSDGVGWTKGIAEHQHTARKRFVNRMIDVVAGQENTPFVRGAMVAEGTSLVTNLGSAGVGYINGDLTVAMARPPVDEWMGVQADSHWASDGISVGTATMFDRIGAFGSAVVTAVANPAAQIDFGNDPFPSRSRR
ncbi:MAG TPA: acyl-CoA thioesterase domain-containing protein [Mycobacterium sp.]|jgi:acyl-CoA thioesterase|nr:acyl-CoA thioesterase domain-containing protein [Mycobacterium sp.]